MKPNVYAGNVSIPLGAKVTLTVTANGLTYTASAIQATSAPVINSPLQGASWDSSAGNSIGITIGPAFSSTVGTVGAGGILDSNGHFVYGASTGGIGQFNVPASGPMSFNVPGGTLSAGSVYTVLAAALDGNITSDGTAAAAGGTPFTSGASGVPALGSLFVVGVESQTSITTKGSSSGPVIQAYISDTYPNGGGHSYSPTSPCGLARSWARRSPARMSPT